LLLLLHGDDDDYLSSTQDYTRAPRLQAVGEAMCKIGEAKSMRHSINPLPQKMIKHQHDQLVLN